MTHFREAGVLGRYVVGADPSDQEIMLYEKAARTLGKPMDRRTRFFWESALRHPWLLGFVDAGLAFYDPRSALRHRIYIMLAILEASPRNAEFFIRSARREGLFLIFLIGLRALGRSIVGALIVLLLGAAARFHHGVEA
ncbi:MAG: hypothetical protein HY472_00920 [Candidatus Sungbacteria bacterium]|nr:hypothetical protein [Candidatus Sungbacteria bacterium]